MMSELGPDLPAPRAEHAAANGALPVAPPDLRAEDRPETAPGVRPGPGHHAPFSRPAEPDRAGGDGPGRGQTVIADIVVEKVAALAAEEIDGVYELGGDATRAFQAGRERVGHGNGSGRGIAVDLDGNRALVDMTLVVQYGYPVMAVADAVRANVIDIVERMLGIEVVAVNIVVDDVRLEDDDHR